MSLFGRLACLVSLVLFAALPARAFETGATHVWVYDMTTQTVLLDKGGDEAVPPASMSKLMTIEMLFEALSNGRVQMDTTFGVSDKAVSFTALGGSTMYLQQGDRPTVAELIKGMIVNSGNDACTVVAEGLEGSEEEFSRKMTDRAKTLGLEHSTFTNSSGWPDPGQRMSMKDLGMLTVHIITTYPELYRGFADTAFNYKDRASANAENRNPILGVVSGADGLKTGHTVEAGYGMVGSVKQGDRRIVFSFSGLTSTEDRAKEAEAIANWAFRQFSVKTVAKAGDTVAQAQVFMGDADAVGLTPTQNVRLLLPGGAASEISADVVYTGPIKAPIAKGTKLAQLIVHVPDLGDQRFDLLAAEDVGTAGFATRLAVAMSYLRARYGL